MDLNSQSCPDVGLTPETCMQMANRSTIKEISMPALYLFTGELYPTTLRNAGVGVSIMFSRIGSMLAPLIITLEEKATALPLIILAMIAFTEVILILALPETKHLKLLETVDDLDKLIVNKTGVNRKYRFIPVNVGNISEEI